MNDFKLENNAKINSGFVTPENYFDDFSEKLMAKLPAQEPKVISFYAINRSWIYSAAAILVIAFTIPVMNLWNEKPEVAYHTEVENYITNQSTITNDDLVELLEIEDIEQLKAENAIDISQDDVLSESTDIEYTILN